MLWRQGDWCTVSQLTNQIKKTIELDPDLRQVWLRAEISNFKKHSRGHMYFTLKDEKSRISAVMFAGKNRFLTFEPENGMKVLIKGNVSVYEPFGQYQLYVNEMEQDGIGQLYLQYEALKKKLQTEGLFSADRKKRLPSFPKEIAIVTSPTGAAIKDMLTTLKRRFPLVRVTLFPVLVQGENAPSSIVLALDRADKMGGFDLIIVGRGGGSIEELWAFNDEGVARKIASLSLPAISAVGHETDFTIADFTADIRAATPTAAAELAVPVLADLEKKHVEAKARLIKALKDQINIKQERLIRFKKSYAFRYPTHLLKQKEQELDRMLERLSKSILEKKRVRSEQLISVYKRLYRQHPYRIIEREKSKWEDLKGKLDKGMKRVVHAENERFQHTLQKLGLLNPLQVMQRGYSVTYNENKELVKSVEQIKPEDFLQIHLYDGIVEAKAESTHTEKQRDIKGDENHDREQTGEQR